MAPALGSSTFFAAAPFAAAPDFSRPIAEALHASIAGSNPVDLVGGRGQTVKAISSGLITETWLQHSDADQFFTRPIAQALHAPALMLVRIQPRPPMAL